MPDFFGPVVLFFPSGFCLVGVYNSEGKIQLSKDLKILDNASITKVEISVAICLFPCFTATVANCTVST